MALSPGIEGRTGAEVPTDEHGNWTYEPGRFEQDQTISATCGDIIYRPQQRQGSGAATTSSTHRRSASGHRAPGAAADRPSGRARSTPGRIRELHRLIRLPSPDLSEMA